MFYACYALYALIVTIIWLFTPAYDEQNWHKDNLFGFMFHVLGRYEYQATTPFIAFVVLCVISAGIFFMLGAFAIDQYFV